MFAHGSPTSPMRLYTARGLTAKKSIHQRREQYTKLVNIFLISLSFDFNKIFTDKHIKCRSKP